MTTVGDRVKLKKNNAVGFVRFIGEVQNKKDIYYGIELDDVTGSNDGCLRHIRYFECEQNKGLFVKKTQIAKTNTKRNKDALRVTVGDKIKCMKTKCNGTIRFIGIPYSVKTEGIFYGIELDEAKGKNNGTIKGRSYFKCKEKYGIFVKAQSIQLLKYLSKLLGALFVAIGPTLCGYLSLVDVHQIIESKVFDINENWKQYLSLHVLTKLYINTSSIKYREELLHINHNRSYRKDECDEETDYEDEDAYEDGGDDIGMFNLFDINIVSNKLLSTKIFDAEYWITFMVENYKDAKPKINPSLSFYNEQKQKITSFMPQNGIFLPQNTKHIKFILGFIFLNINKPLNIKLYPFDEQEFDLNVGIDEIITFWTNLFTFYHYEISGNNFNFNTTSIKGKKSVYNVSYEVTYSIQSYSSFNELMQNVWGVDKIMNVSGVDETTNIETSKYKINDIKNERKLKNECDKKLRIDRLNGFDREDVINERYHKVVVSKKELKQVLFLPELINIYQWYSIKIRTEEDDGDSVTNTSRDIIIGHIDNGSNIPNNLKIVSWEHSDFEYECFDYSY